MITNWRGVRFSQKLASTHWLTVFILCFCLPDYERGRRPSEFSLNMRIFSSWATDRPTDRPWRFSASYIFWTKLPIDKRFSASESHNQYIIRISIATLSIQIRTRDRCGKRPMLAPKTNSEPRNLNFSLQKSEQTARFELNSATSF